MSDEARLPHSPGTLPWLVEIMQRLLAPDGCPWDREQTLETLRPYLVEECYEVLDAIDSGDRANHCEELGDLLLQIVFQAQLARIGTDELINAIGDKLIRRHPHVFGNVSVRDSADVVTNWEAIKADEKRQKKAKVGSVVDSVPRALPALHRTHQLTRKARKAGFTLDDPRAGLSACLEALDPPSGGGSGSDSKTVVGDALLHLATWAGQLGVEPEQALRDALSRLEARVRGHEKEPAAVESPQGISR